MFKWSSSFRGEISANVKYCRWWGNRIPSVWTTAACFDLKMEVNNKKPKFITSCQNQSRRANFCRLQSNVQPHHWQYFCYVHTFLVHRVICPIRNNKGKQTSIVFSLSQCCSSPLCNLSIGLCPFFFIKCLTADHVFK